MTAALVGSCTYGGLAMGPGTKFHLTAISGVDDLPAIISTDTQRPGDDGAFMGIDRLGGRVVTLEVGVLGDTPADMYTQIAALESAFLPSATEKPLLLFGSTRQINARVRRRVVPYDATHTPRFTVAHIELFATDPRVYDAALSSPFVTLGSTGTGVAFDVVWSANFGGAATPNSIAANNIGNWPTRPVITITGPVTNPIVSNARTGKALKLNTVLGAQDTLVIDMDQRTIILNGTVSRRSSMSVDSQWWDIQPGVNTIQFSNNGAFSATAQLTLSFRSSWL